MKPTRYTIVFAVLFFWGCSTDTEPPSHTSRLETVPTSVETVQASSIPDSIEAVGTVKASRSSALSSKIVGTITAIAVKEGDEVRKGQILVRIDRRDIEAQLREARAALEEAERAGAAAQAALAGAKSQKELAAITRGRYEILVARGLIALQEYDEVKARYRAADAEESRAHQSLLALDARKEQALARISRLQVLLSETAVTAPYDGIVTAKSAEAGMLAAPGVALLSIDEAGRYRLEVQAAESLIGSVRLGGDAWVSIDLFQREITATVVEIVPAAEPQSRTFTVKIALPAHSGLRSGLYGKARFAVGKRKALTVPSEALVRRGQLVGVYVADDSGAARLRLITTGKTHDGRVEVLSGLRIGERVVTAGGERVSNGDQPAH